MNCLDPAAYVVKNVQETQRLIERQIELSEKAFVPDADKDEWDNEISALTDLREKLKAAMVSGGL
jgi:hypothetical protein